jgi:phosphoenolpyruvate carboxylase
MDLPETLDKDLPLRDDIRLLGRILGDTVRSQEGDTVFAIAPDIDTLPSRRG